MWNVDGRQGIIGEGHPKLANPVGLRDRQAADHEGEEERKGFHGGGVQGGPPTISSAAGFVKKSRWNSAVDDTTMKHAALVLVLALQAACAAAEPARRALLSQRSEDFGDWNNELRLSMANYAFAPVA